MKKLLFLVVALGTVAWCVYDIVVSVKNAPRQPNNKVAYSDHVTSRTEDPDGRCGRCRWVDLECSHYGGYWTGEEVPCDPGHAGVIVMKHHKNDCGPQHLENYTRERWRECFTPRAQCVCD